MPKNCILLINKLTHLKNIYSQKLKKIQLCFHIYFGQRRNDRYNKKHVERDFVQSPILYNCYCRLIVLFKTRIIFQVLPSSAGSWPYPKYQIRVKMLVRDKTLQLILPLCQRWREKSFIISLPGLNVTKLFCP